MRLGAGVLDVYNCWWAWADAIWTGTSGSAELGSVVLGEKDGEASVRWSPGSVVGKEWTGGAWVW